MPVSGLALPPPFIAQSILQSSVSVYEQNKLTVDNVKFSRCFRDLASVSKLWRTLAYDAASNVALCTLVISVGTTTRRALVELRRQLTLQRTFLVALDIHHIPTHGMLSAGQWAALLHCVPRLQEVKLDSLKNAPHAQLGAIVEAVGQQCRNLQSLVVSAAHRDNQDGMVPHESMRRMLSDPAYDTIKQVYTNTHREGLHRLCVCMRYDLQGLESTRTYMNHVLRYCPNLERFDGYRAAVYAIDSRLCYEQWFMDLELWARFCTTLHHLVEFDWICVPFATRYFEIFGHHAKPKMEAMTFTTAMNWRWDRFMEDVGPKLQEQLTEKGFAGTATHAHTALRACPNLKELRVCWYKQLMPQPPPPVPAMAMMDPEIFGDAFWEAAVHFCSSLKSVHMMPVFPRAVNPTVRSFTDRSLRALARLPSLAFFEAECVNVTGEGIFELAIHHAPSLEKNRRFHIAIGDAQMDSTDERFYDAVLTFLQMMLSADTPLPCMERSVSMSIENKRRNPVDSDASITYLASLQSLIAQVKAKHANVQLSVIAHGCDGTSFSEISWFVFDTRKELQRLWIERDDTPVADSIWNRVARWDDSDDDDDDDDYYDDDALSDDLWEGHSDIDYDDYYQEQELWYDHDEFGDAMDNDDAGDW